jgi:hypothetical protein
MRLSGYDAWRLASPPEPDEVVLDCPACGKPTDHGVMNGEAECYECGHTHLLPEPYADPDDARDRDVDFICSPWRTGLAAADQPHDHDHEHDHDQHPQQIPHEKPPPTSMRPAAG